jgi:hypothetical protein
VPVLAALTASGHVIYPAALALVTRRRGPAPPPANAYAPPVTVVLPSYLEQHVIEAKVADLRRQSYAAPVQIIVVADDEPTAAAARRTGATVISSRKRTGKSAAINRGVAAARHEVIVVTDANTRLQEDALALLVRHFADPAVGAVAGAKHVADDAGQGFYWKFESWLKRRESQLGTTMGIVGELAAFRRSAFSPLPDGLVGDDLWLALDVIEAGFRVVFEPDALANEEGSPSVRVEWERRTRIVAGTLDVLWRRRHLLVPGRSRVAGQLWGHKLLRSTVGPLAHLALLIGSVRAAPRSRLARTFVAGHALALLGLSSVARGGRVPRLVQLPVQVLFLQAVALGGLLRFLRGDRHGLWPKLEREAPTWAVAAVTTRGPDPRAATSVAT